MSGFAPGGCVTNGEVTGEANRWAPTCPSHAGPLSKGLAGPVLHIVPLEAAGS